MNFGWDKCVSGCRHRIWGGEGTCNVAGQGDPVKYVCSCDGGYSSKDSLGNPSCVKKRALLAIHITVAVVGAAAVTFLLRQAVEQRRMTTIANPRRAMLRLRVIYSASAYCGTASIVFGVAAAAGTLFDSGMLQAFYCTTIPISAVAISDIVDVWIDNLPSQLLSADSTATKVIQLAEKRRIFVWFGRAGFVGLATAGLLTTFALDLLTVVRCINAAIAITVLSGVSCVNFVGYHITTLINKSRRQVRRPSLTTLAFYNQAIRTLWVQIAALSVAGVVGMASAITLEPLLGGLGLRMPILPLSITVVDGCVGFSFAVHFAKVSPSSTAPPAPLPAGRRMTKIGTGLKAALADVRTRLTMKGAATSTVLLDSIARHSDSESSGPPTIAMTERRVYRPSLCWAKRKPRVVPHVGEGNC